MTRRAHRRLFGILVGGLLWTHGAAPSRPGPFLGIPWLPFDLGYHLAWTLAAWGVVVYMCRCVWRAEA